MPSRKLTLWKTGRSAQPSAPPPASSSWPVAKYSYSVSALSSRTLSPWSHFPQRDNIFVVIGTSQLGDILQPAARQTRLKLIWGLQSLEDVDLATLLQQTTPGGIFQQGVQAALVAIGRSPCLAIRYLHEGNIRRFQMRFALDATYQLVVASLERAGCVVGPPPSPYGTGEQASQIRPPVLQYNLTQSSPPLTPVGYSHDSTSSSVITPTPLTNPPPMGSGGVPVGAYGQDSSRFNPVSMALPGSGGPQPSPEPALASFVGNYPPSSPPDIFGLPPPRPPPVLGSCGQSEVSHAGLRVGGRSSLDIELPPLPKPTPVTAPIAPIQSQTVAFPTAYPAPDPGFVAGPPHQDRAREQFDRETAATSLASLKGNMGEYESGGGPNYRDGAFPQFQSQTDVGAMASGIFPSTAGRSIPTGAVNVQPPNIGEKRNQQDNDNRGHGQQKKLKPTEVNLSREEEDFAQMENFIVNAIHDDSFLRLVERVGEVWQRMGFDRAVPRLFADVANKTGS